MSNTELLRDWYLLPSSKVSGHPSPIWTFLLHPPHPCLYSQQKWFLSFHLLWREFPSIICSFFSWGPYWWNGCRAIWLDLGNMIGVRMYGKKIRISLLSKYHLRLNCLFPVSNIRYKLQEGWVRLPWLFSLLLYFQHFARNLLLNICGKNQEIIWANQ